MELPHLGQHCSEPLCRQLDYLPMKCDSCFKTFCSEHVLYIRHNCEASYKKNVQVPVCPLCNEPVPGKRDEQPDIRVGQHIDLDCQSDPAKAKRKIYTNKCSVKGCRQKELVKVSCGRCQKNFCLKHRHFQDHDCTEQPLTSAGAAAINRNQVRNTAVASRPPASQSAPQRTRAYGSHVANLQPSMSEDEALARALQMSLTESSPPLPAPFSPNLTPSNQEEADRQLAEALAASQRESNSKPNASTSSPQSKDKCSLS